MIEHDLALDRLEPAIGVALDDLIDVHVAPAAGCQVGDSQGHSLSDQMAYIPRLPVEPLAAAGLIVRPGRRADGLFIDQELHTRSAREFASADQEIEKGPLDLERRRAKSAG